MRFRKSKKKKPPKKPLEFSQRMVVWSFTLAAFMDVATVVCAWFSRTLFNDVTIATINIIPLVVQGGY